jgi:hypothetical protein
MFKEFQRFLGRQPPQRAKSSHKARSSKSRKSTKDDETSKDPSSSKHHRSSKSKDERSSRDSKSAKTSQSKDQRPSKEYRKSSKPSKSSTASRSSKKESQSSSSSKDSSGSSSHGWSHAAGVSLRSSVNDAAYFPGQPFDGRLLPEQPLREQPIYEQPLYEEPLSYQDTSGQEYGVAEAELEEQAKIEWKLKWSAILESLREGVLEKNARPTNTEFIGEYQPEDSEDSEGPEDSGGPAIPVELTERLWKLDVEVLETESGHPVWKPLNEGQVLPLKSKFRFRLNLLFHTWGDQDYAACNYHVGVCNSSNKTWDTDSDSAKWCPMIATPPWPRYFHHDHRSSDHDNAYHKRNGLPQQCSTRYVSCDVEPINSKMMKTRAWHFSHTQEGFFELKRSGEYFLRVWHKAECFPLSKLDKNCLSADKPPNHDRNCKADSQSADSEESEDSPESEDDSDSEDDLEDDDHPKSDGEAEEDVIVPPGYEELNGEWRFTDSVGFIPLGDEDMERYHCMMQSQNSFDDPHANLPAPSFPMENTGPSSEYYY